MTLARWRRTVRKHVPKMASAAGTNFLHPHHSIARIAYALDMRVRVRPEKAGPTRARVEFRVRAEQRQSAEPARVRPVLLVVQEDSAERCFRAVLKQHMPLVFAQPGGDLTTLLGRGWGQVECAHEETPVPFSSVVCGGLLHENQGI